MATGNHKATPTCFVFVATLPYPLYGYFISIPLDRERARKLSTVRITPSLQVSFPLGSAEPISPPLPRGGSPQLARSTGSFLSLPPSFYPRTASFQFLDVADFFSRKAGRAHRFDPARPPPPSRTFLTEVSLRPSVFCDPSCVLLFFLILICCCCLDFLFSLPVPPSFFPVWR